MRTGGISPKQVARALGVSEASVKRWADRGLLPATRTPGGHRRLPLSGVLEFLRQSAHPLVRPEVLGLPAASGKGGVTLERARADVQSALEAGDEERLRTRIFDLFLARHSVSEIGDRLIAPAFHELGCRWQHGALEIFQERRAGEICARVLLELRRALPPPPAAGPRALGGTLEGDPYFLPSLLVETCLRQQGWHADALGVGLPGTTLAAAVRQVRPRLLWVSVSTLATIPDFFRQFDDLYETATGMGAAVVVGGRALTEEVRLRLRYSAHCDGLGHLVEFTRSLHPAAPPPGAESR